MSVITVSTEADLAKIGVDWPLDGDYVQDADITLTSPWTPIGCMETPFTGTYDGGGYSISGLNIDNEGADGLGLFWCTSGATIENLTVNIDTLVGGLGVGGLIGMARCDTVISNCSVVGTIQGEVHVGGIIGQRDVGWESGGPVLIADTLFNGQLNVGGGGGAGGIVGYIYGPGLSLSRCTADVVIVPSGLGVLSDVGGILGGVETEDAVVLDGCSAMVDITRGHVRVGGIIGGIMASGLLPTFVDCSATGTINVVGGGDWPPAEFIGGFGGIATNCSQCSASITFDIEGDVETIGGFAGLLVGNIEECVAASYLSTMMMISGDGIGGFAGNMMGMEGSTISDCYTISNLETFGIGPIGGFAHTAENYSFARCYSATELPMGAHEDSRAFIAATEGLVEVGTNCFYDSERAAGYSDVVGAVPKTTAEMQDIVTYSEAGWDIESAV